jgi:hypothetical protein
VRLDRTTWVIGLDTFDPQADLWQGTCHAAIQQITNPANAGQFHIPINTLLPGANPADPEANVFCAVRFARPAPPGVPFRFTVMVTDRQGNNSNKIRGSVITEGRKDSGQSDDDLTFAGATAEMRP